ncbi:beta-lactamase/transpeptidase-like protein [Podospora fimiseda]|uniref:Beta-lactamase/transpeptidase-like protein n=1 Tax=Podospora fimiseda TaxID=252190 RepID=A0AAN7H8C6_9PEZI|nr:beta-lactamase/transpeptidase-like protein [Podospora fimiseda]
MPDDFHQHAAVWREAINQLCKVSKQVGLSCAVVQQGQVVFTHHFGFRNVKENLTADDNTLYNLASCTKLFTSTLVSTFIDGEKHTWDMPIKNHLPNFKTKWDPLVGERMTIADALSHRTGVSGLDALWLEADAHMPLQRSSAVAIANMLPVQAPFRTGYVYNNSLYGLAGSVTEVMAGGAPTHTWEALMRERLLGPLSLKRTFPTTAEATSDGNCSIPYMALPGDRVPAQISYPLYDQDNFGSPAVGMWSCLSDMIQWSKHLIQAYKATLPSSPVLGHIAKLFGPHTILNNKTHFEQYYGLGVFRQLTPAELGIHPTSLQSRILATKPGYNSSFYLFPEKETAIVVLGNAIALGDGPDWIAQYLTQAVFDLEPHADLASAADQCTVEYVRWFDRLRQGVIDNQEHGTPQPAASEVIGTYVLECVDYRVIVEEDSDGKLWASLNDVESQRFLLHHYHHDIFSYMPETYDEYLSRCLISWWEPKMLLLDFKRGPDNKVKAVAWAVDGITPIEFNKST